MTITSSITSSTFVRAKKQPMNIKESNETKCRLNKFSDYKKRNSCSIIVEWNQASIVFAPLLGSYLKSVTQSK